MTLTLLLDLDDTLLINPFDPFLKAYLGVWGKFIGHRVNADLFIHQLLAGTQAMIHNNDPSKTLEEVFDSVLYPAIGMQKADLAEDLDVFYHDVYPELQKYTQARPETIDLIHLAVEKGFCFGVATNPVFPRTAILQRLEWAGIPASKIPFQVVSSFEKFHFAKPNPAYFAEFIGQMGWPSKPPVMVGNSYTEDILPSKALGIQAYLILNPNSDAENKSDHLPYKGNMRELIQWLDQLSLDDVQSDFSSPTATKTLLRATPAAISSLVDRIPQHLWNVRPSNNEWSITEILCHLRDVDREVNLPRLRIAYEQENPFIAGIDTDQWAVERAYNQQDGPSALQDFILSRMQILDIVERMDEATWNRPLRHAIFGPSTVGEIIRFFATHDRSHLQQIKQNIGIMAAAGQ